MPKHKLKTCSCYTTQISLFNMQVFRRGAQAVLSFHMESGFTERCLILRPTGWSTHVNIIDTPPNWYIQKTSYPRGSLSLLLWKLIETDQVVDLPIKGFLRERPFTREGNYLVSLVICNLFASFQQKLKITSFFVCLYESPFT